MAATGEDDVIVPDGGLFVGRNKSLTIGLVLVVTLVAFEALAVATILPAVKHDLGHQRLYGWAFSAFLLASLLGISWSGEQCDRRGPAHPLMIGLTLFAAGLALAGIAPSMWVVIAGRGVQGLGAGMVPAVAYVTIGRFYDPAQRTRMFAILSSAWVIPGLVGPALAGAVAEYTSWRLVFVGLLPLIALAAALTLPPLRAMPLPAADPAPLRLRPALGLAIGATFLLAGITSGSVILAVVVAPVGALIAVPCLLRLIPEGTLRLRRGLPAAVAGNGLLNLAFFGAEAFVPLMITDVRHQTTLVAGIALTAATLSWTTGAWVLERVHLLSDRRVAVRAGLLLVSLGIGGMASVLSPATPLWVAPIAWGVAGLGMGIAYPSLSLALLADADQGAHGAATASFKLVEVLGPALGVGAAGAIVAAGVASDWEPTGLAVVFALMALAALTGFFAAGQLATSSQPAH